MNDPFSMYRSKGLKVSELAQQLWCETQVALELVYGKPETEPMKIGKNRHEELFHEITPTFSVHPETWIDELFLIVYQMWSLTLKLKNEGLVRELPVFGSIGPMMVRGVIDELILEHEHVIIVEHKTRASGRIPEYAAYTRVVEFQLFLYYQMLHKIIKGNFAWKNVTDFYRCKPPLFISDLLYKSFPKGALFTTDAGFMGTVAFEILRTLPHPSDTLVVQYEDQKKTIIGEQNFIFDEECFKKNIDFVAAFWKGEREAFPVSKNLWKCEYCPGSLRDKCDAYKTQHEYLMK